MIDKLAELVLLEARQYKFGSLRQAVQLVKRRLDAKLDEITEIFEEEQRRWMDDKNNLKRRRDYRFNIKGIARAAKDRQQQSNP